MNTMGIVYVWYHMVSASLTQVDLFSGAVFLETILKWKLYPAIFVLLAITGVYTLAGKVVYLLID